MNDKSEGMSPRDIEELIHGIGPERSRQMLLALETGHRLTQLSNAELVLLMEEHVVFDKTGDAPIKELLLIEACKRLDPEWLPK